MPRKLVKSQGLEISWLLLSFRSRLILGNTTIRNQIMEKRPLWGGWLWKLTEQCGEAALSLETKAKRR